ncbi:PHP domain-containing protein [Oscillatoriales cyanobacterium LEGE 11467]|uniref:PHP domain-containing protein n=1 Tax=Zarconia navalis LEGE 11467 TaxID=1828826 RepID=A0A928VVK6_9CYAN|nr:PHP domain-containing protein [Zarconia navalis]MBE9040083.1 PHP domain-containing protein [Zarconia navalis LEGE 11467]
MFLNLAPPCASVRDRDRKTLMQVFQTIGAESCPREYNFHMHTIYSDGRLEPEALIQQATDIGLKGLAITDHHSVGGYRAAQCWLEERRSSSGGDASGDSVPLPTLWTGVEINAALLDVEVHILGYGFDPDAPAIEGYLHGHPVTGKPYLAGEAIAAIHNAGGLAVLAHPSRYRRSPQELIPEAARLGIDGSEAYYAYNNPDPWQPSAEETERVRKLNYLHNLFDTCGTDTHGLNLLKRI